MNWNNVFERERPTNIYESSLYDEWLDTLPINDNSKKVYKGYAEKFTKWLKMNGYATVGTKEAEEFLIYYTSKAGAKQGNARWSLFKRYCDWLALEGKLSVNPWAKCDLALCGCDKAAVSDELKKKREIEEKVATTVIPVDTDSPKFTLTDVALLLMAIEERDEESIKEILAK